MKKVLSWMMVGAFAMLFAGCASSAQKAAEGGFATVETPASELEKVKADLAEKDIPSAIGMAVSNDEMIARTQAADEARAALAEATKTFVSRYKEQYGKNVDGNALKIWEEKANEYTQQELVGANVVRTITQFNEESGQYKIYVLVAMDPAKLASAMQKSAEENQEFMLRAQSADMQKRMNEAAEKYKAEIQKN
ncbi:MAG: hypothetical protein J6Z31_04155 [Fibrobacter sp.]|nr:hypothetical protein [Fibrobacter sp.]